MWSVDSSGNVTIDCRRAIVSFQGRRASEGEKDNKGHTSEASVDASHWPAIHEGWAQVQEPLAERVEEGEVGEPVQVVSEYALVPFDRLIGTEPDRFCVSEDAAALVWAQDVGEEEGAGHVGDVEPLDGSRGRRSERDRVRGRGKEESWMVVRRLALRGWDGVKEGEARRELPAVRRCCTAGTGGVSTHKTERTRRRNLRGNRPATISA